MDIDLQSVDINQCASGPGWYSNTHLCDLNSTQARRMGPLRPVFIPFRPPTTGPTLHPSPPNPAPRSSRQSHPFTWFSQGFKKVLVDCRGEMTGRPMYSLSHTSHLSQESYSVCLGNLNVPPVCPPLVLSTPGSLFRKLLSLACFPFPGLHAPHQHSSELLRAHRGCSSGIHPSQQNCWLGVGGA